MQWQCGSRQKQLPRFPVVLWEGWASWWVPQRHPFLEHSWEDDQKWVSQLGPSPSNSSVTPTQVFVSNLGFYIRVLRCCNKITKAHVFKSFWDWVPSASLLIPLSLVCPSEAWSRGWGVLGRYPLEVLVPECLCLLQDILWKVNGREILDGATSWVFLSL